MSQVFILHFCCGVQVDRKYGLNDTIGTYMGGGGVLDAKGQDYRAKAMEWPGLTPKQCKK